MLWFLGCEMEKVVPVAGHKQVTIFTGMLEDGFVGGICRKSVAQKQDVVAKLLEQVAQILGPIMVELVHPPNNRQCHSTQNQQHSVVANKAISILMELLLLLIRAESNRKKYHTFRKGS